MFRILAGWIENRRQIRQRWQQDARTLIKQHGREAYYEAQRLASRSRAHGDRSGFWHWAKVASEVARLSPIVQMDMKVVQVIADDEMRKHRRSRLVLWRKPSPWSALALPTHPRQRGDPAKPPSE